jgi:hypothetical protein
MRKKFGPVILTIEDLRKAIQPIIGYGINPKLRWVSNPFFNFFYNNILLILLGLFVLFLSAIRIISALGL